MSEETKNPNVPQASPVHGPGHPLLPHSGNSPRGEVAQNAGGVDPAPDETALPAPQEPVALAVAVPTAVSMWNDVKIMNHSWRTAKMLSSCAVIPELYRQSPENCLVALDLANRMGLPPLAVMQNLYVVKGKPSWSGSFCAAAVNGSGRFTPLEYVFVGEPGTPSHGCYATAIRLSTGARCVSETVTMAMAKAEGWLNKTGSKWLTMPVQMMMYRAAAFFGRVHCSDILLGLPTYEEVQDVRGYEPDNSQPVTVTLDQPEQGGPL